MLAHQIYTAHILGLRNGLGLPRRKIPATAGKGLRQHLLLSQLARHRADLLGGVGRSNAVMEEINAGEGSALSPVRSPGQ